MPVVLSEPSRQHVQESASARCGGSDGPVRWSVIVPTYNRPAQILRCYEHLLRLEAPWGVEIIIVDDGSAPPIDLGPLPDHVRLIHRANHGTARTRNFGAAEASGEFLAFTDDDCAPAPDWLVELDATLAGRSDVLAGGTTVNGLPENIFAEATQELVDFFEAWEARAGEPRFFVGMNMGIARATYHAMGGFPGGFRGAGEDRGFCDVFRRNGGRLVRSPARVVHLHELDARTFLRQHAYYGRGAPRVYRMRKDSGKGDGLLNDKLHMIIDLARFPFRRHEPMKAARLCTLLALSQVATAWGYAAARFSRDV